METDLNADLVVCICNVVCLLLLINKAEDADANACIAEHLEFVYMLFRAVSSQLDTILHD
jgi:hypothetical protein